MKGNNIEFNKLLKNKKVLYCVIVIITLLLYHEVRKIEENSAKKRYIDINNNIKKTQIENDINLTNSKLLNMRIDKESIQNLILLESEKEYENNINKYKHNDELWIIETFFLTLFCAIIGGMYYYAKINDKEIYKGMNNDDKYYDLEEDYTKFILDEPEIEFLINKEEEFE